MTHEIAKEIEKDCWGEETPAVGLSELHDLLCVLDRINGLCIGEIAMGCKVDANHIGEMIYEATGMNAEELTAHCKKLNA